DAMDGLELCNRVMSPDGRAALEQKLADERRKLADKEPGQAAEGPSEAAAAPRAALLEHIPAAPDHDRHVMQQLPLDEAWSYITPKMLYGKHLGLKGNPVELLAQGDPRAKELQALIEGLEASSRPGGASPMAVRAVWQFFPASSAGDTLRLHAPRDFDRIL